MKQIFQSLSSGDIEIEEVPAPNLLKGCVLISTSKSLLSAGTERMLIDFGKSNLINKAIKQPSKVRESVEKIKSEGPLYVYDAIKNKLEEPIELGYCNVGTVIDVGEDVNGFNIGDRVVSNGSHAEIVCIPQNLCALIPDEVSDEQAVFLFFHLLAYRVFITNPTWKTFLVSGLGLIGLLTCQLLIAQGCKVLGIDPDESRCKLAESLGINIYNSNNTSNEVQWCLEETSNQGVDGAIITASTSSNLPLDIAAKACRKRGRIILVGVTGLNIKRDLFYKKELSFQVSCSYGPGRYDDFYEKEGNDYPYGFVGGLKKKLRLF